MEKRMSSTLLQDVVAYVEVRSNNDNRSAAVCKELQQLGARVESTFTDDVTHVIFKEGMRRTYNKAQKKGIPLVSVTWLESCKSNQKLMPEKDYATIIPEETNDSPLFRLNPHRRWRKMKSMQPYEYEEEVARSAERSVKRRRRVEVASRFKSLEDFTPTSSSPSLVLVPETQRMSPFLTDLSTSHSPSLATVADTPVTPTMKERIEKMRKEQQNALGAEEQSPKGTGRGKSAILQKRLFEKLAKDIFSTEDSDGEDDDTTARVVAKLIDGLESQEEDVDSPRKRLKRMSSQENVQDRQDSTESGKMKLKSPSQTSFRVLMGKKSPTTNDKASRASPRRQSLRKSDPSDPTALEARVQRGLDRNAVMSDKSPQASKKSVSNDKLKSPVHNSEHKSFSYILNSQCDKSQTSDTSKNEKQKSVRCDGVRTSNTTPNGKRTIHTDLPHLSKSQYHGDETYNATATSTAINKKKKKILLSESESYSSYIIDPHQNCNNAKESSLQYKLLNGKRDKLSGDISFLFGVDSKTKKNVSANRRRSARLQNMDISDSSSGLEEMRTKHQGQRDHLDGDVSVNGLSTLNPEGNSCMSVIDEDLSGLSKGSGEKRSRHSLDDFSLVPKEKVNSFYQKRGSSFPNKCNSKTSSLDCPGDVSKTNDGSENKQSQKSLEKKQSSSGRKAKQISNKGGSKSSGKRKSTPNNNKINQTSSTSEDESNIPRKLRHVNSLVMEMSVNVSTKTRKLSLVMTSLHRHEQEVALSVVKKLGMFKVTDTVNDKTTHLICGGPRRTLNLLQAICRGCWVLKKEWVLESLEAGRWLSEEDYEMVEEFPVAKDTRRNRMEKGLSFQVDLLSKCGPIFVAKNCVPPRNDLVDLITLCSGSVTNSQQRAAIHVDSDNGNHSKDRLTTRPEWILDSIMKMKVADKEDYLVESPVRSQREASPEF